MKTKNNVQKAIFLKAAAVVVSLVLISFTVSAQDFWKRLLTNSSFNEIALAMVEPGNNQEKMESNSDFSYLKTVEPETESALELEPWMTNGTNFYHFTHTIEPESNLELEEWMFEESLFECEQNADHELELETWMTTEAVWKI